MNNIKIIREKESLCRKYIEKSGFTVHEEAITGNRHLHDAKKFGFTVIESKTITGIPSDLLKNRNKTLIVTEQLSTTDRNLLIGNGISHLLLRKDHQQSGEYLKLILKQNTDANGEVIILDNNNSYRSILKNIFFHFGYQCTTVESHEPIFENLGKPNLQFILINLACSDLDVNGLVREAFKNPDLKKIPVIIYKDMSQGIFVHEVIAGLNRLTKFILSPQELFSFIIELLTRKNITPLIKRMNLLSEFSDYEPSSEMPLKQMYFCYEKMIFAQDSVLETGNLENLLDTSQKLRDTIIKCLGISWLKEIKTKSKVNTCGAGG